MERLSRWKVELFCTDNWGVYPEVIVADKLYQSKSQTVYLEQNNGRQRHWFARFRRKSIVVSKTLEMVDLTMALFARFHVMEAGKILRHYLVDTLKNKRWRLIFQPPPFLLVHLIRYDGQNRNHHWYPFSETHIFSFLSGYETGQTTLACSSAIPFDVFSETRRYPRRKPQSAQSAGIRHAFLLKAPSSSPNSAGASCGNVSMTRLA